MLSRMPSFKILVHQLKNIPYLASKNLYRVAEYILAMDPAAADVLCQAILDAKKKIKECKICCNFCEPSNICSICSSQTRDHSCICVVETWSDLVKIESSGDFNGVYHVLKGVLSPIEGIGPDDISAKKLVPRIKKDSTKEVILATNNTPEGEATANFVANMLKFDFLEISRLASGIPVGSILEYMDKMTVHKAISERRPF